MPRYVILEHDHPFPHWDLMLETGDALRTFRLLAEPRDGFLIAAEASFDHRPAYLDYEGPISGDRGRVIRWDAGHYESEHEAPNELILRLEHGRLEGTARLNRTVDSKWQFLFTRVR